MSLAKWCVGEVGGGIGSREGEWKEAMMSTWTRTTQWMGAGVGEDGTETGTGGGSEQGEEWTPRVGTLPKYLSLIDGIMNPSEVVDPGAEEVSLDREIVDDELPFQQGRSEALHLVTRFIPGIMPAINQAVSNYILTHAVAP